MATFLDITVLENFSNIFVFLFVWLVIFAIFSYAKILGQNKAIAVLVGFILAFLSILSELVVNIVLGTVPWIILLFVILTLLIIMRDTFGGGTGAGFAAAGPLAYVLVVFLVIGVIVGILTQIRQDVSVPEEGEKNFSEAVTIFFHPNFLGMLFLLMLAAFTIVLLTSNKT